MSFFRHIDLKKRQGSLADAVPREYPVDEIGAKFDTSHVADRRYRLMQQTGHDRFVASSAAAG